MDLLLIRMNSSHNLTLYFFKICLNIILQFTSRCPKLSMCFASLYCLLHDSLTPVLMITLDWLEIRIVNVLIMQFSQALVSSSILFGDILLHILLSNTCNVC